MSPAMRDPVCQKSRRALKTPRKGNSHPGQIFLLFASAATQYHTDNERAYGDPEEVSIFQSYRFEKITYIID